MIRLGAVVDLDETIAVAGIAAGSATALAAGLRAVAGCRTEQQQGEGTSHHGHSSDCAP